MLAILRLSLPFLPMSARLPTPVHCCKISWTLHPSSSAWRAQAHKSACLCHARLVL